MVIPYRSFAIAVAASLLAVVSAAAHEPTFAEWLDDLRHEAKHRGIRAETLDRALADLAPIPRVIELDRDQPEFKLTFAQYLARVVPDSRVHRGQDKLRANRVLLDRVAERYGVPSRFIVALWGIESDFGRLTGGFSVIAALATLAFDGRRSDYFRKELFDALAILDQGHISPERMTGSWAGAMGQSQFMPSSFVRYAVDFDGDGRRDIWNTRADVFASAANYLEKAGWRRDRGWGFEVRLPAKFDPALAGLDGTRALAVWRSLGVAMADGSALPDGKGDTAIVLPSGGEGPAYLVSENFAVILKWNRSTYFALAVGHLADGIGDG